MGEKRNVPREARSNHDGGWYDVHLTGRWAADGSTQQVCDRGSARTYYILLPSPSCVVGNPLAPAVLQKARDPTSVPLSLRWTSSVTLASTPSGRPSSSPQTLTPSLVRLSTLLDVYHTVGFPMRPPSSRGRTQALCPSAGGCTAAPSEQHRSRCRTRRSRAWCAARHHGAQAR